MTEQVWDWEDFVDKIFRQSFNSLELGLAFVWAAEELDLDGDKIDESVRPRDILKEVEVAGQSVLAGWLP